MVEKFLAKYKIEKFLNQREKQLMPLFYRSIQNKDEVDVMNI